MLKLPHNCTHLAPGGLPSFGSLRVRQDWATSLSIFTFCHKGSVSRISDVIDISRGNLEHYLALPFFKVGIKTECFQSCGHRWVFQICWHIECSIFPASSYRVWNGSIGIISHPITLFIMILSKTHLTSHSRMSGSRWVITPSWLDHEALFCTVLLCILATSS